MLPQKNSVEHRKHSENCSMEPRTRRNGPCRSSNLLPPFSRTSSWLLVVLLLVGGNSVVVIASKSPSDATTTTTATTTTPTTPRTRHISRTSRTFRLPGRPFDDDDDDDDRRSDRPRSIVRGRGREFRLFDTRGGFDQEDDDDDDDSRDRYFDNRRYQGEGWRRGDAEDHHDDDDEESSFLRPGSASSPQNRRGRSNYGYSPPSSSSSSSYTTGGRYGGRGFAPSRGSSAPYRPYTPPVSSPWRREEESWPARARHAWQSSVDWLQSTFRAPRLKNMPRIQCRVEPTTTLKIRKTFRPLKTIVRLGADFNTQLGVWQFKSSWEDALIGGKLTLAGRELQLTKSWTIGSVQDIVTRIRFRAAIDLHTYKAYARVGFRTERLTPVNVVEGFTVLQQIPLDGRRGNDGHVKLEVKAHFALPEPEIEYSTEAAGRSVIGMGDIEINIDELNLVLDY